MQKFLVKLNLVLTVFAILLVVSVGSYAYFTADVAGNETASNNVITTGHMAVEFIDGNTIGTTANLMPGDFIEKHFSVKNTGTVETIYNIYLNDVYNDFNTRSDLVYELISENGANIDETMCPMGYQTITTNISIGPGITHNYTLKITFKNLDRNQDDNKGKTFKAKVDIVEQKIDTIVTQLIDLKKNGATDLEYDGISTLGENGTVDNNLRYIGANPNNYIYFNCDSYEPSEMNDTTCEKWRIIGLMNNVEDNLGNKTSRVKIMRDQSLKNFSWDTSESINNGWGINQWGESTHSDSTPYEGADIKRELNTDYLGNITVGTDGYWYGNEGKYYSIPDKLMDTVSKELIQKVKWHTGTIDEEFNSIVNSNDTSKLKTKSLYNFERSTNTGKICTQGTEYCEDDITRTTEWIGKVGLMHPSDYGYSTSGGTNLNRAACLNIDLHNWSNSDIPNNEECYNNSWIQINNDGYFNYHTDYFINPSVGTNNASEVFTLNRGIGSFSASDDKEIRPTLYLIGELKFESGDGSKSNPYKLASAITKTFA